MSIVAVPPSPFPKYIHIWTPRTSEWGSYLEKRIFAEVIKDLKMGSSWITEFYSVSNVEYLHTNQKRRKHKRRGEDHVKTEREIEILP